MLGYNHVVFGSPKLGLEYHGPFVPNFDDFLLEQFKLISGFALLRKLDSPQLSFASPAFKMEPHNLQAF